MEERMEKELFRRQHELFASKWALATAGTPDDYNTMTIGWGGLGTLWGRKLVCTVYIRPDRYTYEFMEKNGLFTVSFYPEECRGDLQVLGTLSGRDGDKVAKTSLKPIPVSGEYGETVTFDKAELTLVCRKIYADDFHPEKILCKDPYAPGVKPHRMYIGEVLDIL